MLQAGNRSSTEPIDTAYVKIIWCGSLRVSNFKYTRQFACKTFGQQMTTMILFNYSIELNRQWLGFPVHRVSYTFTKATCTHFRTFLLSSNQTEVHQITLDNSCQSNMFMYNCAFCMFLYFFLSVSIWYVHASYGSYLIIQSKMIIQSD